MEGDAGTRPLNPTDAQDNTPEQSIDPSESVEAISSEAEELQESVDDGRRPTRIGRGWALALVATLVVLAGVVGTFGYLALQSHRQSQTIATDEAAAVKAAKECVSATQAPDTTAMSASQAKIIECSTGDFGAQATLFSGVLLDAYQAANAKVQVSDMRAAVEKHNDDESIDVLVAVRVKVTNSDATDQETGYRLRVRMMPADGTYKVAKLDQVAS